MGPNFLCTGGMFSQLFLLNQRGDVILFKDYRGDVPSNIDTAEVFFSEINRRIKGAAFHYVYVLKEGIYTVLLWTQIAEEERMTPFSSIQLINKLLLLLENFCGTLSEENLRKNFSMAYQILDETIDYGYPQTTETNSLMDVILDKNAHPPSSDLKSSGLLSALTAWGSNSESHSVPTHSATSASQGQESYTSLFKSFVGSYTGGLYNATNTTEEGSIYVDIVEKINVILRADGEPFHSSVTGSIEVKNKMRAEEKNRDMVVILRPIPTVAHKKIVPLATDSKTLLMDDVIFHRCALIPSVNSRPLKEELPLDFKPPAGPFTLLHYRASQSVEGDRPVAVPFIIKNEITVMSENRVDISIKIECLLPTDKQAHSVKIQVPVPKSHHINSVSCQTMDREGTTLGTVQYSQETNQVTWNFPKFYGGMKQHLRIKCFTSVGQSKNIRSQIVGSVSVHFEIPMWTSTGLRIKSLNTIHGHNEPTRWIRYITQSDSYQARLG
ncbi:clathrin coat assembly protein [Planoprotostelium fungivorum]|uniref:Clathrin coat assembly protein n=1 Tax=Planoprotostelium fungivorum TaxID=1890364 RepID=A0A2P6MVQ6_9EUKA|nr:clathrin coat assembly protein [Planoprotostelium fungivorum]